MARSMGGRVIARLSGLLSPARLAAPASARATFGLALAVLAGLLAGYFSLIAIAAPPQIVDDLLTGLVAGLLLLALLRWPKSALLVFALFMLFGDTVSRWLGYGLAHVDELFVPLALAITAFRARPWRGRLEPVREGAVLALVGLALVASLVNGVPLAVWLPGMVLLVKVIAFLYVCAWHDVNGTDIRQLGLVVLAVGVVAIGLGYIEAIDIHAFRTALNVSDAGEARGALPSVKGIFYHPVLYAWFAALLGLYCFALFVHYRRWYWLIGGLFFSVGVLLAARRRAIVGLAAAVVGGAIASWWPRRDWRLSVRLWAPVAAGLLALGVVFAAGLGDLIEQTQAEYLPPPVVGEPGQPGVPVEESEGTARETLYRGALVVAADYFPLGAGLGRYGSWMSRIEYSPLYHDLGFDTIWGLKPSFPHFITDTFWPQILGEIGVFGVLAYLVFIGAVGVGLWRAAHAFDDPLLAAFCLGTLMVFGHALIETLASSMFHSPPRVYLLFGAVGMALSLARLARVRAPG